jgi:hypothetical protein
VPSNFIAATASDLIADIKAANQQGGSNTITLVAPTTSPYVLTAVDNSTDGPTGLPVIAANDILTIVGNGNTIERNRSGGTPAFRLFDVAARAALTLQNLTSEYGCACGAGVSAEGGAIYNQGTLDLNGVAVQNNAAAGNTYWGGASAAGGGIYSNGTLTLEGGSLIQSNFAWGQLGGRGNAYAAFPAGGNGFGGGLYVAGGTVTVVSATLSGNTAQGGRGRAGKISFASYYNGATGGNGGNGYGGGLYVAAGTVNLTNDTLSANSALGGSGGNGGNGYRSTYGLYLSNGGKGGNSGNGFGAGLYVAGGSVNLTNDIVSSNSALGGDGGAGGRGLFGGHGGNGGNGFGGGLYVAGGAVDLTNDMVFSNSAVGGQAGYGGYGRSGPGLQGYFGLGDGGGLYINTLAAVCLDTFTQAHVTNNSTLNIVGSYTLCP